MTHPVFPLTCPIRDKRARLSLIMQKIMAFRLKCFFLYSSHTLTHVPKASACPPSMVLKNIYINASFFRTRYKSCQLKILSLVAQPRRKIVYAHNNWPGTMWVHHLSERIHFIGAKTKSNIPWIVRKVLSWLRSKCFHCLPSAG
jgi:hypothetical protein